MDTNKIIPDPLKDQFFLEDTKIIENMITFADLNTNDVVLEIGAGTGNLTKEIAKKAGRVIAFEIDEKMKPFLKDLPKNVEIHFENAWEYVQLNGKFKKKKEYNKVVSNPPYSFIEPFLHNLTFLDYKKVILVVPKRTLKTIETSGVFSSFFKTKILLDVPARSFNPIPKTSSVVIDLIKLDDPIETKNPNLFLKQYIYQHENQLVKNSLMEGIIKYAKRVKGEIITKNQARKTIDEAQIKKTFLESKPESNEIYNLVSEKFSQI